MNTKRQYIRLLHAILLHACTVLSNEATVNVHLMTMKSFQRAFLALFAFLHFAACTLVEIVLWMWSKGTAKSSIIKLGAVRNT